MKIKKIIIILVLSYFTFTPLIAQDYFNTEIISIEKTYQIIKKLRKMDLDYLMEWKGRIYIILHPGLDDFSKLEKANISYRLETHKFYPYSQKNTFLQGGINGDYHSYQELERDLIDLEESYPHLAKVYDIGDSLEKRNIYALKISDNVSLDEKEAEVLFIGCHHAREWISVEIPFLFGKYLVENYNTNPEIKSLVDKSQIWIIPLLNPDGLEYSIHFYRYWRKNRRDNGNGSYGVDLNRNYGYRWGDDNEGSSPNPNSYVYRGKSPFSEPETQAIRDLFSKRNFQALISYHSFSQVILYPWGYTKAPSEKDNLLYEIAANMSKLIQSVNGNIYEFGRAGASLYLTNGDTTDWALGVYNIPSYTIELPPIDELHGGFFNPEKDIQSIFKENLPAALYLIKWSAQNFKIDQYTLSREKKELKERKNIPIFKINIK